MAPRRQSKDAPQMANPSTAVGTAPGARSAVSPLEDLMRRKGVDTAWDALEEMQRTGLPTDRFTVSRMLMKTLADGRRLWEPSKIQRSVRLVEGFVEQQPEEADEVLFNALLDTHCRMKNTSGLEAAFRRMTELKIEPSHVTLGILVKAYGQACDVKSVLRLWDEMADQRSQANAVTYGCMINACVRCGKTEKAVEIFQEMKMLRKHCNTILYTTLIKGYGNEKDISNALDLFKEMKAEGVPYNTIAYNSIIDVCIKCGDVQAAEDVFREMIVPTSDVQPDLITYSTLLKGYCQVGNLDKALQVAETIKACGLRCDELVYNTLMDGCVKAGDVSAGIGLFEEMVQMGMRPSTITHSILARLYQRAGYEGDSAEAVAQLYQHHGVERPCASDKGKGTSRKFGGSKGSPAAHGSRSPHSSPAHSESGWSQRSGALSISAFDPSGLYDPSAPSTPLGSPMGSPSGRPYLSNEALRGSPGVPPLPGSHDGAVAMGQGTPMAYGMVSMPMSGNCTPVGAMVQGSPAGSVHGSPMGAQPGMEQQHYFGVPQSPHQQGFAQGGQPGMMSTLPPWPVQQQYPGALSTPPPNQYPSMPMHDAGAMQQWHAMGMIQDGSGVSPSSAGGAYGAPVNQQYDPVMAGMPQQPQQPQQQGQQAYFAGWAAF
mmetsp:Transcript_75010/g.219601  ORF Transcript_75010/g.219601 Transcript_75010/m.219601 type:complete len:657 (-) Transcript_75010:260-2230(-)